MNRSSRTSMIYLLIMTLIVMTFNGLPVSAHPFSERGEKPIKENHVLKMNDYIQHGTDGKLPILWRVIDQDAEGFFLCQDQLLQKGKENSGKHNKVTELPKATNLLEEGNINLSDVAVFYVPAHSISFKIGEGTFERPYILYTAWKEGPQIKAQGNQVILYNVQLIGDKDPWQMLPTIQVGSKVQNFVDIKYDANQHTLTYELAEPIKANEKVTFAYTLPPQVRSAIAKTDQQQVLTYMFNTINNYKICTSIYPTDGGNVVNNSSSSDELYYYDEWVTLTAHAKENYEFVNWTENGKEVSRNQTYSFQIRQDRNLVANFNWVEPEYVPQYTIYVTVTPEDAGTVRGDYTYNKGEYATLEARAKEGYIFESWTEDGDVISRNEEYSFTVKENRRLEVNFEKEEKDFKEEWRDLSSKQQRSIKRQFEEYLPYTTLEESLTLTQLERLTKGYFTREQLRELNRNLDLLETINIDLDWEEINLKKISHVNFIDLSRNHWAYKNIIALAKRGVVTGYPDQTFKPNQPLTVADTFTFLDRILLLNEQTDVKQPRSAVEEVIQDKRHWAFNHMASIGSKLSDETLEIIGIMGNNCYVSRGFLAQVLYEVTDGKLSKTRPLVKFTDTRYSAYEEGINYCIRTGLLEGTSYYTMEPNKTVTRAEMMTILQRLDDAFN